jgi:predicted transcriptional regulator
MSDVDRGPRNAAEGNALLSDMYRTVLRYGAIRALVSTDCLDQLREGPLSVTELADRCGLHAPTLSRLLRAAAPTGLLRTVSPGTYELTEAGQVLLDGTELLRTRWCTVPEVWTSIGELTETVRSGKSPFVQLHGNTYNFLATRPEESAAFDALMVGNHGGVAERVASSGAFPSTGTVVDVGGGKGTFLAAILRDPPALRGILLELDAAQGELERTVDAAREYLTASGVASRCEVVAGDFFKAVPSGADVYLLASIIHNWDDDEAADILRTVRTAIPEHGRLLLVEVVLPDDDSPHPGKDMDIRMLTMHEGKERSRSEFSALLGDAGFRLDEVTELTRLSLILGTPV